MENASDALKMSVAALIFVSALTLAIIAFTKARSTATSVLMKSDNLEYYNTENIRISENRIVGIETVIPTLYSYFNEGYTILFYDGRSAFDRTTQELKDDSEIKPLTVYYSEALKENLVLSKIVNKYDTVGSGTYEVKNEEGIKTQTFYRAIYGFDANDENVREEPWLHDEVHAKEFIKSFINNLPANDIGEDSKTPSYDMVRQLFEGKSGSPNILDRSRNKLYMNFNIAREGCFYDTLKVDKLSNATKARFIERIGIYNEKTTKYDSEGNLLQQGNVDSSQIEFSNNETIQNTEGTQKRVIQYIYIGNDF